MASTKLLRDAVVFNQEIFLNPLKPGRREGVSVRLWSPLRFQVYNPLAYFLTYPLCQVN